MKLLYKFSQLRVSNICNCIVLRFNDTLVSHFVSSPREREKKIEEIVEEMKEMKEMNREERGTGMKVKKQKK